MIFKIFSYVSLEKIFCNTSNTSRFNEVIIPNSTNYNKACIDNSFGYSLIVGISASLNTIISFYLDPIPITLSISFTVSTLTLSIPVNIFLQCFYIFFMLFLLVILIISNKSSSPTKNNRGERDLYFSKKLPKAF